MLKKHIKSLFAFFILLVALLLMNVGHSMAADASSPSPSDGAIGVPVNAPLSVDVGNINDTATATFYGREAGDGTGDDFTIIALPDTQHYSDDGTNFQIFIEQTQWVIDERESRNIVLVDHLGDIVNDSDTTQWNRAAQALLNLNQNDIAVGIAPGNHDYDVISANDGPATLYDQHLPATIAIATADGNGIVSYEEHDWYGGYKGGINDPTPISGSYNDRLWKNNYVLFSAGGMDFINIAAEYNFPDDTPAWIDAVLDAYPDRRAIISTHQFLEDDNSVSTEGGIPTVLANVLAEHCNVFLILSAHNHYGNTPGEAESMETNACGDTVHLRMSDYQDEVNGGDGWLRIMTFHPDTDTIDVETYSPTRNGGAGDNKTDGNSQFTLAYAMDSGPTPWIVIESGISVSGGAVSTTWSGLDTNTEYEWYVELTDGSGSTDNESAPYSFTTELPAAPAAPSGLTATAVSSSQIDLSWTDTATTEDNYLIYQGPSSSLTEIASIVADSVAYSATGLSDSTQYCFEVYARNAGGDTPSGSEVCATTDAQPSWVAYIDANTDGNTNNTDPKVLGLDPDDWSGVNTYTLKNFNDSGNEITGVEMAFDATGLVDWTTGVDPDASTDSDAVFGGIVDQSGMIELIDGDSLTMEFMGLDNAKTYELVVTANRDGGYTRATEFQIAGMDAFTESSSAAVATGTNSVVIVTGDNTEDGYVARWTGINPGADGEFSISSIFNNGDGADIKSYAAVALMLAEEADPVVWSGATDNNWSIGSNWVGGAVPTATDIVQFIGGTSSEDALVDTGFGGTVAGVLINNAYEGSINFARSLVVEGDYSQDGGTVIVDPAHDFTVTGSFTHSGGTLQETKPVNNEAVNFLQIQTSTSGGTDVYRGVDLSTSSDLGDVTVSVKAVDQVTEYCTSTGSDSTDYVGRCFDISPTSSGSATVTLWALTSEIPGDVSTPSIYHYSSGDWVELTGNVGTGISGDYTWVSGDTTGFSPFLIADDNSGPTAISLQSFSHENNGNWQLVILFALMGMGTAVLVFYRTAKRRSVTAKAR